MKAIFKSQYRHINELASAFDSYETSAAAAYEDIRSFLDTVNRFLEDSSKVLFFDEHSGDLSFDFIGADRRRRANPLSRLSSGEKQVLMLFTFMAFVSKKDQVFIVDEPELSLHPKWQSNFLEAMIGQAPERTQIILATHSPEIVGRFRDSCVLLEKKHA